jgi:hypothetical protein
MKRAAIFCFLLSMLTISCQGFPAATKPDPTDTSSLTESKAAFLARAAIKEIVGQQLVQVNWLTLRGDLVFVINYATDLKPSSQSDDFSDQFNHIAFITSKFFYQTNTQSKAIMVMAQDVDFPTADRNPPLYQVVIRKEAISAWSNGETSDAEFIQSWFVVPLEVFPTPG